MHLIELLMFQVLNLCIIKNYRSSILDKSFAYCAREFRQELGLAVEERIEGIFIIRES